MLALFTTQIAVPVDEPIDRDSGIITLTAALVRAIVRRQETAFQRRCDLVAKIDHHTHA